ncbi:hypothetical protein GCM10011613_23750 [Cellvibrio zantedeschiae]|uniref:Lipoprotein n=1 Tax=Cellvibrio zantedeschiae TaxID=1237077 RepID=A0ABQ3B4U7_9GAMM|nr:hypothetical protein [Cellvibrio zantedeschiae]GGY78361.1 hypothetical protein GCM10011613_23750 [Cellvibrio zantedeschiae]
MLSAKVLGAVLVVVCGCLVACGTPGRSYTDTKLVETLEIEIMPNTSKMFVYRLRLPEDRIANGVKVERGGFQRGDVDRGGVPISSSTPKRLLENTGYVVERLGYCREGFLEIDSSVAPYNLWMKGECKEGATEEDKKKFGTKQTLAVTLSK